MLRRLPTLLLLAILLLIGSALAAECVLDIPAIRGSPAGSADIDPARVRLVERAEFPWPDPPFTVDFWYRHTAPNPNTEVVALSYASRVDLASFRLALQAPRIKLIDERNVVLAELNLRLQGVPGVDVPPLNDGRWYHVAVRSNGTHMGVVVAPNDPTSATTVSGMVPIDLGLFEAVKMSERRLRQLQTTSVDMTADVPVLMAPHPGGCLAVGNVQSEPSTSGLCGYERHRHPDAQVYTTVNAQQAMQMDNLRVWDDWLDDHVLDEWRRRAIPVDLNDTNRYVRTHLVASWDFDTLNRPCASDDDGKRFASTPDGLALRNHGSFTAQRSVTDTCQEDGANVCCPTDHTTADADGDCLADAADNCPLVANYDQTDGDSDGQGDACDPCPVDNPDDTDADGQCDSDDPCPLDNPDDPDSDGVCDSDDVCWAGDDNLDTDGDGVADACDCCPLDDPNDTDGDQVCESDDLCPGSDDRLDADSDSVPDGCDPCPLDNPDDSDADGSCDSDDLCADFDDRVDTDADGVPDACDPCPLDDPDDSDGDGVCDQDDICADGNDLADRDHDGLPNFCDPCPNDLFDDSDGDGVCDSDDPCPNDNPDDADSDGRCDSDGLALGRVGLDDTFTELALGEDEGWVECDLMLPNNGTGHVASSINFVGPWQSSRERNAADASSVYDIRRPSSELPLTLCKTFDMPLDWLDDDNNDTIAVTAKRVIGRPAPDTTLRSVLTVLGDLGDDAVDSPTWNGLALVLHRQLAFYGTDVVLIGHRGIGTTGNDSTSPLACPDTDTDDECLDRHEDRDDLLPFLTPTQAAADAAHITNEVGRLVDAQLEALWRDTGKPWKVPDLAPLRGEFHRPALWTNPHRMFVAAGHSSSGRPHAANCSHEQGERELILEPSFMKQPHAERWVLGVGYGGYVADRLMQIDQDAVDFVIMDALRWPANGTHTLATFDEDAELSGSVLLDNCDAVDACRHQVGASRGAAYTLVASVTTRWEADELQCGNETVFTVEEWTELNGWLRRRYHDRALVLPLAVRLDRCALPRDIDEFDAAVSMLRAEMEAERQARRSTGGRVVEANILLGEFRNWYASGTESASINSTGLAFNEHADRLLDRSWPGGYSALEDDIDPATNETWWGRVSRYQFGPRFKNSIPLYAMASGDIVENRLGAVYKFATAAADADCTGGSRHSQPRNLCTIESAAPGGVLLNGGPAAPGAMSPLAPQTLRYVGESCGFVGLCDAIATQTRSSDELMNACQLCEQARLPDMGGAEPRTLRRWRYLVGNDSALVWNASPTPLDVQVELFEKGSTSRPVFLVRWSALGDYGRATDEPLAPLFGEYEARVRSVDDADDDSAWETFYRGRANTRVPLELSSLRFNRSYHVAVRTHPAADSESAVASPWSEPVVVTATA